MEYTQDYLISWLEAYGLSREEVCEPHYDESHYDCKEWKATKKHRDKKIGIALAEYWKGRVERRNMEQLMCGAMTLPRLTQLIISVYHQLREAERIRLLKTIEAGYMYMQSRGSDYRPEFAILSLLCRDPDWLALDIALHLNQSTKDQLVEIYDECKDLPNNVEIMGELYLGKRSIDYLEWCADFSEGIECVFEPDEYNLYDSVPVVKSSAGVEAFARAIGVSAKEVGEWVEYFGILEKQRSI